MTAMLRGRRPQGRRRASIAVALARSAPAGAYPGYRRPDVEHRTRAFLTGAALVHATAVAVLVVLASLAPRVEERILHLRILKPEPPPVVEAVPEPAPPPPPPPKPEPVHVEVPKPKPPPPPAPKPEPPAPKPTPPVAKPEPIAPPALPPIPAPLPEPARVARPAPPRPSAVRVPAPQIDSMTARPELPEAGPVAVATHRQATLLAARSAPPAPASIDRVAVPRPALAPEAPESRAPRAASPPAPRAERPATIAPGPAESPRPALRGVALSELLPCVSDARELELKQRTVGAAQNRALCESPAGRFHFIETKNVNAFLMRIEQSAGRRSGDRCEELKLALECLASLPPRSRR